VLAALACGVGLAGGGCVGGQIDGDEPLVVDAGQVDAEPMPPDAEPVLPSGDIDNVLIVGWDGVQRDHLNECMSHKLPECPDGLPNLRALSDRRFFDFTVTTAATCTKPGWVEILTGYDATRLGIEDNSVFRAVPSGYSVLERLEAQLGADEVETIFLASKKDHVGGACDTEPQQPWCEVKQNLDHFQNDLGENENVGNLALELLREHADKRIVAFFHFGDPDHTGHAEGESSSAYTRAIVDDDRWLGELVAELEELGKLDRTLIYVVTDHGFDEGGTSHKNAPYGFLATNDPLVVRSGDRKDLAATLLDRFGVPSDGDGTAPPVDGRSLASVQTQCIDEGHAYFDYPGASVCCEGLKPIGLRRWEKPKGKDWQCMAATGKRGDKSGYCTLCGDGVCSAPENRCNCAADCAPG